MTKRRRAIVLALAGLLFLLAFGPALLILAGAEESAPAPSPSARPIISRPSMTAPAPTPTPSRTPAPTLAACEVSSGRVFLRAAPRRASRALDVLAQGQRLLILATPTDPYQNLPNPTPPAARWLPVQAGALAGWIYSDFCKPLEANQ